MAEVVYLLCGLTSVACAALLIRSYVQTRTRLLLWSSICFAGLALNNVLLFIDLVLVPEAVSLAVLRSSIAGVSLLALIFGFIWDVR